MADQSQTRSNERAVIDALLSHAAEDFYGLWEALPAVRSVIDGSDDQLIAIASPVLKKLWEQRLIEFVWGDPSPRPEQKLNAEEVARVLCDAREWSGERAYAGRLVWFTTRD